MHRMNADLGRNRQKDRGENQHCRRQIHEKPDDQQTDIHHQQNHNGIVKGQNGLGNDIGNPGNRHDIGHDARCRDQKQDRTTRNRRRFQSFQIFLQACHPVHQRQNK